jgi:hypothetical protein
METKPITQLEFAGSDFELAEAVAKRLGFTQTVYTSSSALIGLFCLPDRAGQREGCIIKTREFGLMFVSDLEDLKMDDLNEKQRHPVLTGCKTLAEHEAHDTKAIKIGAQIAEVFCMRKSKTHKDRWQMSWGNKTALGVYNTFKRIADEITNGTFKP